MAFEHILISVDGSEPSLRATQSGIDLAKKLGAKLTLFHVLQATSAELMGMRHLSQADFDWRKDSMARDGLKNAIKLCVAQEVEFETSSDFGDVASDIVAEAKRRDVDLIVMGSRGLSEIEGLLMGGVSTRVAGTATCPVMLVK